MYRGGNSTRKIPVKEIARKLLLARYENFSIFLVALLLVRQLCEDRVEELSRNALIGEFEESGIYFPKTAWFGLTTHHNLMYRGGNSTRKIPVKEIARKTSDTGS
jgi:uncharacterized membrane protein